MNALFTLLALLVSGGILVTVPAEGGAALLVCVIAAVLVGLIISRVQNDKEFLLHLFIGALLVRVLIGTIIFAFNLQDFFGGDAYTYDFFGYALSKVWQGDNYYLSLVNTYVSETGAGAWGMFYFVAFIYTIIGRNMLAIQFVNAVLGAATAPVIFLCAKHVYNNLRVARLAGFFVAFYPSLVLWSSQGLKDGPIVFLLAISILATFKLGENINLKYLAVLASSLFAILTLRFYVFYMIVVAAGGSLLIGMRMASVRSLAQRFVVIIGIGLALTYLGVLRTTSMQFESFGNLEKIQVSRSDMMQRAETGFGKDVDVSTVSGAFSAIPVGATYLLFAPFPWQLASLRQSITFPEMVVWWASFPLLVLGLWFTIKYRLRQSLPILIFTAMLTLAYSLFQGNVGTAYRQRAQLLVFYFIFVSVGYVLMQERRENRRQKILATKHLTMPGRRQTS
ncbi:MAG: glycosyltransferase family 39 protein [Acidobacteria bacterium]|nr:glycosyltransferase family 39 protein [Acidobacteriota bacterium]